MAILDLWMNGERVAEWERDRRGIDVLRYRPEWLASPHVRPISLSLPLLPVGGEHRGDVVDAFFENLLPDSEPIRRRMRQRFHTRTTAYSTASRSVIPRQAGHRFHGKPVGV